MTTRKTTFAALVIALVLTSTAFGGAIHTDRPSSDPAPTPTPTASTSTDGGATTNGAIHTDSTGADGASADSIMSTAVTLVQLVLSLF